MPATLPAKEVGNLISSPEFPNAVQWAEDGTLAVAEGNGITLLNPSALNGPRSFCAVEGFARDDVTEAAGVLRSNQGSSVHYDLATSSIIQSAAGGKDSAGSESGGREKRDASSQPRKSLVSPRAMAWSPPAAGPWGSSLLATVLTDHRIIVYGPQQGMSPEWKELVSLHHDLLNYMANESCDVQTETRPVSAPDPPKARSRKPQPSSKPAEPQKSLKPDSLNLNTNEVQGRSCAVESESIEKLQLPATTNTHHSTEPLTKQQAALEAVSRFFTLRRQLSAPEVPTYPTPNSHLKDADLSCLKQAMDAVWGEQNSGQNFKALGVTRKVFEIECRYQLRLAWDRFNNVTREGYEEIVGLQGPGGPARHASEEQVKQEYGETTESDEEEVFDARRTRTSKRTKAPEPKDTVSWLDLPPVNTQSAGDYKKSLISGAVKRFLCVRSDSEEEVVTYRSSSQHLKAQDVALLERVVEEYMEAFEEALGALNLGKATFQQLVTVQLRKMWDRATGRCIPPDLNFKETSRDIVVANGGAKSNGDDGPPVVPILGIASHRLSGSGVRGRGGSRGKTRGGGGGGNLTDQPTSGRLCTSPQEYERRLLSLSSISCAWSPILNDQNDMRFSLLAVGTKEGRVWLWRYRHGVANAYVDAFDGPSRFTFLGCCFPGRDNSSTSNVPVAWSSALSWVKIQGDRDGVKPERVVLVTGASDGSISLSARKVCDLQATELSAGNVLDNLDAALLRGNGGTRLSQVVTCISAKVVLGGSRLVVVAAGGMGIVKIWAGGVKGGQNSVFIEQEHVYFCSGFEDAGGNCPISSITGLCFTGPPEAGDDSSLSSPLMIVACNRQGSMASWSLPCDRIKALKGIVDGCEGPVACFKRMKPVRELGFGTFGLAASPGGGFVVTARCALPKGIDFVKQLQVWQRLTLGYVHLYRTIGPSSANPIAEDAIKACCEGWARQNAGPLPWDIVQGIRTLAVDIEPLVLTWESTFSKNLHQFRIPSSVNDESWHLLMSAVALRHASGSSSDVKGGRLALQTKYELLLLQRQAEKVMRARDEDNTFSKIARLAAAEFVLCLYSSGCSLEQPFEDLVQFALEVYRKVTGQSVGGGSDFKPDWRQVIGLEGIENGAVQSKMIVPCPTTGSEELLSAALRIGGGGGDEEHPDKESTIVPQCPASFLPVVGSRPYSCRLCQRAYNMHVPCCVLCGFAVGLVGPDFLFLPP